MLGDAFERHSGVAKQLERERQVLGGHRNAVVPADGITQVKRPRTKEILTRDVPVTFLFPYYEAYAAHRKISGLRTPDRPEPIGAIIRLRMENER